MLPERGPSQEYTDRQICNTFTHTQTHKVDTHLSSRPLRRLSPVLCRFVVHPVNTTGHLDVLLVDAFVSALETGVDEMLH